MPDENKGPELFSSEMEDPIRIHAEIRAFAVKHLQAAHLRFEEAVRRNARDDQREESELVLAWLQELREIDYDIRQAATEMGRSLCGEMD